MYRGIWILLAVMLAACEGSSPEYKLSSIDDALDDLPKELQAGVCLADGVPEREYFVYEPSNLPAGPVPLVVYLHGCNQTGPDAAVGTRWAEVAEREKFIALFPEQKNPNNTDDSAQQAEEHAADGNGAGCWNWFRAEHFNRNPGEPAAIACATREVIDNYNIDEEKVFIAGISAGGIMTSTMVATYPDLYAAGAVVAGCGYPACSDTSGSLAYQAMQGLTTRQPLAVFHASSDEITAYPLGQQGVRQWLATNDQLDDDSVNNSVNQQAARSEDRAFDPAIEAGGGDTCVRNSNSPCPAGALGLKEYPHTVEFYDDANGCPLLEFWTIHGGAHNYNGGDTRGTFVDPVGPNITEASWSFFQKHGKDEVSQPDFCSAGD